MYRLIYTRTASEVRRSEKVTDVLEELAYLWEHYGDHVLAPYAVYFNDTMLYQWPTILREVQAYIDADELVNM